MVIVMDLKYQTTGTLTEKEATKKNLLKDKLNKSANNLYKISENELYKIIIKQSLTKLNISQLHSWVLEYKRRETKTAGEPG